jgi:uncharacterized protein (DUF58 family)
MMARIANERLFVLAVCRVADLILASGQHSSRFVGRGYDYAHSRTYCPGDPSRCIDWRMTARTGHVGLKEFESLRGMPVYIVLDTSRSMRLSSTSKSKFDWATEIAGGLALAAVSQVGPVQIMFTDGRTIPLVERATGLGWLHELRREAKGSAQGLKDALHAIINFGQQSGLVYILSDCDDLEPLTVTSLVNRHDVAALRFEDPVELGMTVYGVAQIQEAETGHKAWITGSERWRGPSEGPMTFIQAGGHYVRIPTSGPVVEQVCIFLRNRRRRRRLSS